MGLKLTNSPQLISHRFLLRNLWFQSYQHQEAHESLAEGIYHFLVESPTSLKESLTSWFGDLYKWARFRTFQAWSSHKSTIADFSWKIRFTYSLDHPWLCTLEVTDFYIQVAYIFAKFQLWHLWLESWLKMVTTMTTLTKTLSHHTMLPHHHKGKWP